LYEGSSALFKLHTYIKIYVHIYSLPREKQRGGGRRRAHRRGGKGARERRRRRRRILSTWRASNA
jgi:hypothetical protein